MVYFQILLSIEKEGTFKNSFCKANIILKVKPDKYTTRKEYLANIHYIDTDRLKNSSKPNLAAH